MYYFISALMVSIFIRAPSSADSKPKERKSHEFWLTKMESNSTVFKRLLYVVHPLQEWIYTCINAYKVISRAINQEFVEIYYTLFLMSKRSSHDQPTVGLR